MKVMETILKINIYSLVMLILLLFNNEYSFYSSIKVRMSNEYNALIVAKDKYKNTCIYRGGEMLENKEMKTHTHQEYRQAKIAHVVTMEKEEEYYLHGKKISKEYANEITNIFLKNKGINR